MKNKKARWILGIVIVVLAILLALAAFWYINYKKEVAKKTTKVAGELTITNLKFCNNVDVNFICDENKNAVFNLGSSIYIYFKVKGFTVKNKFIGYTQSLKVIDPKGNLISEISTVWVDKDGVKFVNEIPFYNELQTEFEDEIGVYKVEVIVKDKISGREVTKSANFKLDISNINI